MIYPYRLAYITLEYSGNKNVFSENLKTFQGYSEATLAHEFLHYLHNLDSIPLDKSHCVMLADHIKISELMAIVAEKHGCKAKFLIRMELLYLKYASEKCRK